MSCNDCAAEALGIATDAQFLLDYPGCTEGQLIYCVNGALTAAPRGCTRFFGQARHDNLTGTIGLVIADGEDYVADGTPGSAPLTFTNDTCYPMNIEVQLSSFHTSTHNGAPSPNFSTYRLGFSLYVDGVLEPDTSNTGGGQLQIGNDFRAEGTYPDTYTHFIATPLAPAAAMTIEIHPEMDQVTNLDPRTFIWSWSSAARVVGTTVCP